MRQVIAVAVVRAGKVLVVRKADIWILPGGKPNPGETHLDCLLREVSEELPGFHLSNIQFYKIFSGEAPHQKDVIEVSVYLAEGEGSLEVANEIDEALYCSPPLMPRLSDVASQCVDSLYNDGYLNA